MVKFYLLSFLLATTFCWQVTESHSFKGSSVIEYNQYTLPTQTGIGLGSNKLKKDIFIMFYASWCPHCQKLLPTWIQFKENHPTDAIAAVNCPDNHVLCEKFSVKGYPTLLLFSKDLDEFCQFEGQRSMKAIEEYWGRRCQNEKMIEIPEKVENNLKVGNKNGQEDNNIGQDGTVNKEDKTDENSKEKQIEIGVAQQQLGKKIKGIKELNS